MDNILKLDEKKINKLRFEEAMALLEDVLRLMESGELGLEESMEYFKKGSELYRHCRNRLNSAEGTIKVLIEDEEGKLREEPLPGKL